MKRSEAAKPKTQSKASTQVKPGASRKRVSSAKGSASWDLKLYVAGNTPKSMDAFKNLKAICEEHLKGLYRIDIVDLLKQPQLARGDQILAIPTLVRRLPEPIKKIIGDLSNTERVLVGLNIKPVGKR